MIKENQRFETREAAELALIAEGYAEHARPLNPEWPWIDRSGLVDARIREVRPDMNLKGEHFYRVNFRA